MNFKKWFTSENSKIKNLINANELILFLKKENDYFGTNEDGRITFAKMKSPKNEKDELEGWQDDANFTCFDLKKLLKNQPCETVFDTKSMKKISVVTEEEVLEKMK